MITVRMVQHTPHSWTIENQTGHIIQKDITAHSVYEATEYVKRYISSFNDWTYEIVPLKPKVPKK